MSEDPPKVGTLEMNPAAIPMVETPRGEALSRGWRADFRRDVSRYTSRNGGPAWKQILFHQGLWACLQYRIDSAVYRSNLPRAIKTPTRAALTLWHKAVEIIAGIDLPCTATIGPGLQIPHAGGIVLHARAVVGSDCTLSQGVTIGISGRGKNRGVPTVGDRVYIGVNAVVVGKIAVGDESVVGANSLVNRDVPPRCTVLGVPAKVVGRKGSEDYIEV